MFFTTTNCESDHSISLKFIKVQQLPVANVLSALNLVRDLFIKGRQKWNSLSYLDKLLLLGHRSLIKKITQTAVINIVFQRIFKELDVSYASPHTFSKVTVTIFEN